MIPGPSSVTCRRPAARADRSGSMPPSPSVFATAARIPAGAGVEPRFRPQPPGELRPHTAFVLPPSRDRPRTSASAADAPAAAPAGPAAHAAVGARRARAPTRPGPRRTAQDAPDPHDVHLRREKSLMSENAQQLRAAPNRLPRQGGGPAERPMALLTTRGPTRPRRAARASAESRAARKSFDVRL